MKDIIAVFLALSSIALLSAQSGGPGLQVVVEVEARRVAGQDVTEQSARIFASQFPDGKAQMEFLTDGQAVRSTVSGTVFGLENGTVRLVPRGSSQLYVLNPSNRTYYLARTNWGTFAGSRPEVNVGRPGGSKRILGYPAQRVTVSYRQMVKVPKQEGSQEQTTREVRIDLDNWCTRALKVPSAMARMMDMMQRFAGGEFQYSETCPMALESVARVSVLPGYEIVLSTQSIRRLSRISANVFQLPGGYRRVDPDGKTPDR